MYAYVYFSIHIKEPLDEGERGEWKTGLKLKIQKAKIMASSPITSQQKDGETMETMTDFIFGASKSLQMVTAAMKLKETWPLEENYDQLSILKIRDITLPKKSLSNQTYGFCNNHVWMLDLDYKESWAPKNWCFWTLVLDKTLESPLDSKEI